MTTVPIQPGLFQANYGPHGNELIRLEVPTDKSIMGMKGIKVTGDPNVPFDKITFEIDAAGCLDIPMEKQLRCTYEICHWRFWCQQIMVQTK